MTGYWRSLPAAPSRKRWEPRASAPQVKLVRELVSLLWFHSLTRSAATFSRTSLAFTGWKFSFAFRSEAFARVVRVIGSTRSSYAVGLRFDQTKEAPVDRRIDDDGFVRAIVGDRFEGNIPVGSRGVRVLLQIPTRRG